MIASAIVAKEGATGEGLREEKGTAGVSPQADAAWLPKQALFDDAALMEETHTEDLFGGHLKAPLRWGFELLL